MSRVLTEEPLDTLVKKIKTFISKHSSQDAKAVSPEVAKAASDDPAKATPKETPTTYQAAAGVPAGHPVTPATAKALEPAAKPKFWVSAGGVVVPSKKDLTQVLVIKPSNNYGPWSFPKGRIDEGESQVEAATREVIEETGVSASLLKIAGLNPYVGAGKGSYTLTHFYLMYRVSGTPHGSDETEKALFVPWDKAIQLFHRSGNRRDPIIAQKAMQMLGLDHSSIDFSPPKPPPRKDPVSTGSFHSKGGSSQLDMWGGSSKKHGKGAQPASVFHSAEYFDKKYSGYFKKSDKR